jgi:glycosidase
MPKRLFPALALLFFLSACASLSPKPVSPPQASVNPDAWWQTAVFYEVFVRSYYDTNGDGIGDFNGITAKLDYLQDLGVTALWLMPIHPSPSYHGYDVTDYYAVNPEYGSMDDFKNLLAEAHERDMRVIIDLVINHTSSQHPWFVDSNASPESEYRDFYLWADSPDEGNWHQGQYGYYYGFFWEGMPDLNYTHPAVTEAMYNINDYWLNEVGVDGFRIDAVKHLIEQDGKLDNTPATHKWLKEYYKTYEATNPGAYTIGEVYGAGSSVIKQYTGSELDHIFNFEMASGIMGSVRGGANSGVVSAVKFALMDMPDFNYATFLTNHDQNRVMSVFNGDVEKAKTAAFLLLTMPGTPFIYYGEEIGMTGVKPDEDIRLPMQWSDEANAGFTTGTPWRGISPGAESANVEDQEADSTSLLEHYKTLIQIRRSNPALQIGDVILVETDSNAVFAIMRSFGDDRILIVANLKDEPVSDYSLSLATSILETGSTTPEVLFGNITPNSLSVTSDGFSNYQPTANLGPYQTIILSLK